MTKKRKRINLETHPKKKGLKLMLENKQTEKTLEEQIRELREENEMISEQLQLVQAELEKYYYKVKKLSKLQLLPNIDTKKSPNYAMLKTYSSLRHYEIHNTFQYRIGNAVLKLKKSLLTAPIKLFFIFLFFMRSTPPEALGGKDFNKVIEAYLKEGKKGVKNLLHSVKMTSIVKANAYTALAKHLQTTDLTSCIYFASLAYKTDPQVYRLKWWIFRLSDKGDYTTAWTLANLLPPNIQLNAKEKIKIEFLKSYHSSTL